MEHNNGGIREDNAQRQKKMNENVVIEAYPFKKIQLVYFTSIYLKKIIDPLIITDLENQIDTVGHIISQADLIHFSNEKELHQATVIQFASA